MLSDSDTREIHGSKGTRLPLALVLVSLAVAVATPRMADRRIAALRDEINEMASPARQRLTEVQLQLALEAAQRRGYLLAGDEGMAKRFTASRERRLAAEREFVSHVRRLERTSSARLTTRAERLSRLSTELDSVIVAGGSARPSPELLEDQGLRFRIIQSLADTLATSIDSAMQAKRTAIGSLERTSAILSALLVLLGLIAAFFVARLGNRFREIAVRLEDSEQRARDIAEAEHAARTVAEHRQQELERVTESRARLLRGFTHDVKNPLGSADGFLSLVAEGVYGDVGDKARPIIGKARRAIRQALELIAQLLEIARAESGQLEIHPESTFIQELVNDIVDNFRPQAEAKNLALNMEPGSALPAVHTDPVRVRQVVGNLVSNAVKYTPRGGHIVVRAISASERGSAATTVLIEVSDDGPGIPQQRLPLLFLEFTRFDPGAAEGSGIGLAISQKIAQALGGSIMVESQIGKGTTFSLHLPLTPTAV